MIEEREWVVIGYGTAQITTLVRARSREEAIAKVKSRRSSFEWEKTDCSEFDEIEIEDAEPA